MQLNNLKVGTRLNLGAGILLLIMVLLAGLGIWRMQIMSDTTETMVTEDNVRLQETLIWRQNVEKDWIRTRAMLFNTDPQFNKMWQEEIDNASASINEEHKKIESRLRDAQGAAMLNDVNAKRSAYRKLRNELLQRNAAGEYVVEVALQDLYPLVKAYDGALGQFLERQKSLNDQAHKAAVQAARQSQIILGVAVAVTLVLGLIGFGLLGRSITGPLMQAAHIADGIAHGNLAQTITAQGNDETAALLRSLHEMQTKLAETAAGVRQNADSVSVASTEIAQGNNDLSARTEQQASALEQTAASMEQLGSAVRQNADNAAQANQLALNANDVVSQSGSAVDQMVSTMREIQDSSQRIADIIGVIDSIAFQTNILALNAAVEAARAGEQGRGFAVVAAEVRTLAGRSADAAKEIKVLIDTSVERVSHGTQLADRASASMQETVGAIRRVTDIMGEISAASREQSAGVTQVSAAVTQMDQATQQNAALVEESAAAADSLRNQAAQLVQAMAFFQTPGSNSRSAARMAPAFSAASAPSATAARPTSKPAAAAAAKSSPAKAPSLGGGSAHLASASASAPAPARTGAPAPAKPAALTPPKPAPKPAASDDDDWETF